ncbi:MAG: TolB family protein [Chloroflexia bacterium]
MRARRFSLWSILALLVVLGCDMPTPPPPVHPTVPVTATPTPTPVPPTAIPPAWPAQRQVFEYLEKIWLVQGSAPYALTVGRAPALSPDGERVAYLLPELPASEQADVYVLTLGSGEFARLSEQPGNYGSPVWSPDGQRVAYTAGSILVVSPASGGEQRVLAQDVAAGARIGWSSDGTALVCALVRDGETDLYAIRLADGQTTRLTYVGLFSGAEPFLVLARGTEVDQVLFAHPGEGGTIWSVGIDGSERQRFLPEPDRVMGRMAVSPDGRYLAGLRQESPGAPYEIWTVDLSTGERSTLATLQEPPLLLWWDDAGGSLYWVDADTFWRYAAGEPSASPVGRLPAPTPLPTATPLPISERLVYYHEASFYQVQAYLGTVAVKEIPATYAGASSVVLHRGKVAFVLGPDVYTLQLEGGVPRLLYTFQQEGLLGLQVAWSREGTALLYAASYREEQGSSFGVRVDLGLIELEGPAQLRFASVLDWAGAAPLAYDEISGQAIVLPRGQDPAFVTLQGYDVRTGQLTRLYPVEGEGTAAVSWDQRRAVTSGYDREAGRAFLRLYDLEHPEDVRTVFLPEGLYTWGPLFWSPDDRYVAFIPLRGDPFGAPESLPEGIWVLVPESGEMLAVASVDAPQALLVGWK